MHGRSRSCGSQYRCSCRHWGTSPDMPDCWPANRQDVVTLVVKGSDHWLPVAGSAYLCSFDKLLRCIFLILLVAPPGSQRRRLQGSAKGESQDPRFGQRAVVDGIQVDWRLLLTLTTREKGNSCAGEENNLWKQTLCMSVKSSDIRYWLFSFIDILRLSNSSF